MKKFMLIALTLCFIFASISIVSASGLDKNTDIADLADNQLILESGKLKNINELQQVIDQYFDMRLIAFNSNSNKNAVQKEVKKDIAQLSDSKALATKEMNRLAATDNMALYHGVYVVSAGLAPNPCTSTNVSQNMLN